MSSGPSKKSKEASGHQEPDSVFDFLYHDPLRIASFLGQFDPSGVAQSLKRTDQTSSSSSDGTNDALKFNIGVASGALGEKLSTTSEARHGAERTYDPLWSNARAFLDYLEQKGMIERDLLKARIGQFVLFRGALSISDLTLLSRAWTLPQMRTLLGADTTEQQTRKHRNSSAKKPEQSMSAFGLDMLSILPHSVQATVSSSTMSVWANLKPDCLATEPSDLTLKHGFEVPGEWNVLGILDAQPSSTAGDQPDIDVSSTAQVVQNVFKLLAPLTRTMMGRPDEAFAVTPLLLFREVSGRTEAPR